MNAILKHLLARKGWFFGVCALAVSGTFVMTQGVYAKGVAYLDSLSGEVEVIESTPGIVHPDVPVLDDEDEVVVFTHEAPQPSTIGDLIKAQMEENTRNLGVTTVEDLPAV